MSTRIEPKRGQRYGRLRYIGKTDNYVSPGGKVHSQGRYLCDCGKKLIARNYQVRAGRTQSCGCWKRDKATKYVLESAIERLLYLRWKSMHNRCYNKNCPAFPNYGGRGITVTKQWRGPKGLRSFIEWGKHNGFSRPLFLDRIDNDKGYSPTNCRWATQALSNRNRTNTRRVRHPFTGRMVYFADLYDEEPRTIKYVVAYKRLLGGKPLWRCLGL